jgi:hypothetical protein
MLIFGIKLMLSGTPSPAPCPTATTTHPPQELQERGVQAVLATPRTAKRGLAAFSTPCPARRAADTPRRAGQGRLFGRRLGDLVRCVVPVGGSDLLVPDFVVSACGYIEDHVTVEGLYRMSGSQGRQKAMRAELEERAGGLDDLAPPPPPLDVASLLKQFLRELPEPAIPRSLHPLLASCHASSRPLENLQLALLLAPAEHAACLSFLLRHLARVAAASSSNRMGPGNLAIVLSPNLLPGPEAAAKGLGGRRAGQVEASSARLKQNTAILELLVQHADSVGFLPPQIEERYQACLALPAYASQSQSEGELLDEETVGGAARRKVTKKKHVRRRSGSLSRVFGLVGKAMGLARATPGGRAEATSVHSTPLPAFGGTPAFPSPRGRQQNVTKRNADGEHDLSPTKKLQRRALENTYTPKMRKRSFSVKRFKRKKSETKLQPMRESMVLQAVELYRAAGAGQGQEGPGGSQAGTPELRRRQQEDTDHLESGETEENQEHFENTAHTEFSSALDEDYAEVNSQHISPVMMTMMIAGKGSV